MLVLYDDYKQVWNNLRFNSGSLSINMPSLTLDQKNDYTEEDCDNDNNDNNSDDTFEHRHKIKHEHSHNHGKEYAKQEKKQEKQEKKQSKSVEGYENINTFKSDFENIN